MPTKPLERLIFAQGGLCFFCREPLAKADASVEHLIASANGGNSNLENCVACCKTMNSLLGSMSLKEKFQVVLNQCGDFKCPARLAQAGAPPKASTKPLTAAQTREQRLELIVANLRQRTSGRPRTLKTLRSTVAALFGKKLSDKELDALLDCLESTGTIGIDGAKLTYRL